MFTIQLLEITITSETFKLKAEISHVKGLLKKKNLKNDVNKIQDNTKQKPNELIQMHPTDGNNCLMHHIYASSLAQRLDPTTVSHREGKDTYTRYMKYILH